MRQTLSLSKNEIHVWYAHLSSYGRRCILSEQERRRAARLRDRLDYERFVASHSLWRSILGAYLAVGPDEIEFAYAPLGKPYLRPPRGALRFSGSHSQDIAAIALAWDVEIGLDIEDLGRTLVDASGVAAIAFSPEERCRLAEVPASEQAEVLLKGWTQKEAIAKALGLGLYSSLRQISISPDAFQPFESLPGWQIIPLLPGEGAVASLAAPNRTRWQITERWWSEHS